jgi:hypothetical protein
MPELPQQARAIGEGEARRKLLELYFRSVGAAQIRDVVRLFGWKPELAARSAAQLTEAGLLTDGLQMTRQKGTWLALTELAE